MIHDHSFLGSLSDTSIFAVLTFAFVNLLVTLLARDLGEDEVVYSDLTSQSVSTFLSE